MIKAHLEPGRGSGEHRLDRRMKLRLVTSGRRPSSHAIDVTIQDLSTGGLLIQSVDDLAIGEQIDVHLPKAGIHLAEVVWSSGTFFGCRFLKPLPREIVSVVDRLDGPPVSSSLVERPTGALANSGDFAARLTALQNAKGWTQDQLAERLDVNRQTIWYWETDQRWPRADHFRTLAKVFGVAEWELLPDEDMRSSSADLVVIEKYKRRIAHQLRIPESRVRIFIEY